MLSNAQRWKSSAAWLRAASRSSRRAVTALGECEEAGGIDLIVTTFRRYHGGGGSLAGNVAYGATDVLEMAASPAGGHTYALLAGERHGPVPLAGRLLDQVMRAASPACRISRRRIIDGNVRATGAPLLRA